MEIMLVPTRDSHNSHPSAMSSAVKMSSDAEGARTASALYVELPDGRELTLDAIELGRALRALGVEAL